MKVLRVGFTRKLLVLCLALAAVGVFVMVDQLRIDDDKPGNSSGHSGPVFVPAPVEFAPGLYVLGAMSPSVAYVVETSDGLILIDAGLEDGYDILVKQFELLGLKIQDLKLILITHGHGDHYLGAAKLRTLTGALLYAGRGDSEVLRSAGPREAVFSTFPMDGVPIVATDVDVELTGDELIELGDTQLRAIATPGHTPGSICYWMERNGQTALFSGDTIMTIYGDLGTYSTFLAPRYRGDAAAYLASLKELHKLPVPDLLLPGHPSTQDRTVSPQLTSEQWGKLLNRGIQEMEKLTARYEADGPDFLDGQPRELLSGLFYLGDFGGRAMYCIKHESSLTLFDAPGGSKLVDFLEERLGRIECELDQLKTVFLTGVDPESADGLASLVEKCRCEVVVEHADVDQLRERIPEAMIVSIEESLKHRDSLELKAIRLSGYGPAVVGYSLAWQGQRVLITGRYPLKIDRSAPRQVQWSGFNAAKFLQSIEQLQQQQPQLWLPGHPVHGQNANLYDDDWNATLREVRLSLGLR